MFFNTAIKSMGRIIKAFRPLIFLPVFLVAALCLYPIISVNENSSIKIIILLVAFALWFGWTICFGVFLYRRSKIHGGKIYFLSRYASGIILTLFTIFFACWFGALLEKTYYFHKIKTAVQAGLQEDCASLLRNWPTKDDRIYNPSPEFEKLPSSIRLLKPVYVVNDSYRNENIPKNIGLCKNGFGGFSSGVRIFSSDQDAEEFIRYIQMSGKISKDFGYKRLASGIYYWWQNT